MPKHHMTLFVCIVLAVEPLQAASQPDMVARVVSGELREAKVSWWGFDPEDSTQFLQVAINSKVPRLIVDQQASAWITGPLFLVDDQEIVFEEGVELLAKAGLFRGMGDSLLAAWSKKNLKLTGLGQGAVLRMRKSDYHAEPYSKAEWRHGIDLRSVENVTVENLSIVSTGGDGIFVGPATRGAPSRNVTIKNVVCDDNNRQGISVTGVDKLLIEDCVLKNTWGTDPAAGIDFEPDDPDEQLTDCIMRRCLVENNGGAGIQIYLIHLEESPTPISIRVEDCIVRGSKDAGFYFSVYTPYDVPDDQLKGTCEMTGCRFEDCGYAGIVIDAKRAELSTLVIKDTTIRNCGKNEKSTPVRLRMHELPDFGGIDLGVIRITDLFDRSPIVFDKLLDYPQNVRGTLHLQHGEQTETIEINDAWFAREYPNVLRRIPLEEPVPERFVPLEKADVDVDVKFPPVWQRSQGTYWIYAEKGTPIRLALAVRQFGSNEIGKSTGVLTSPDGNTMKFDIPADKAKDFGFVLEAAPETGVFCLKVDVQGHAVQMLRCNQTVVLPTIPRLDLIYTTGTLWLHVPPDAEEFGVRVRGEPNEAVKASVVDPSGRVVWTEDNIVDAVQFDRTAQGGKIEGIWQIVLDRPGEMVFEDSHVTILGVPPLLGLNPKQLLVLHLKNE